MKIKKVFYFLLPTAYCLRPNFIYACAVCFGKTDNANLVKAFTWGVALMLGFTFLILGVLTFVIYRARDSQKTS